ncbi:MAG: TonB-dependent receptor [Gemmatimonadota bacterium]|nr:TonB-dependent receptor [Gemmatimonadota bacterium]MDQ8166330.1 TonB-dependent receptor [Gemmatimonadota bacterium]MDQ8171644.1 TonB-dependent receptor [Gemmatimonadota bacterium]
MHRSHASVPPRAARRALRRALGAALLLPCVAASAHAQVRASIRDRAAQEKERAAIRPLTGQAVIDGVVTDTLLRPLGSADVSVVGTSARVITNENGRFRMLQVPSGQYLLVVRRIGYAPTSGIIQVPEGDTVRLSYTLIRSNALLDTVRVKERRVTMRMVDFEVRRRQGQGQFVTQEDIERRGSLQTSDFMRAMRGVEVSRVTTQAFAGTQVYSRREGGGFDANGQQQFCAMQVVLDGIVLPRNFDLDLLPPPKQIAGIEVYTGAATIPPQFGGPDRRCGVVAVWTRDGY